MSTSMRVGDVVSKDRKTIANAFTIIILLALYGDSCVILKIVLYI